MKPNTFLTLFIGITIIGGSSYFFTQDEKIATTNAPVETPSSKLGISIIKEAKAKSIDIFQANVFDYSNVKNTAEKKQVFFDALRPIIISQNQLIKEQREKILLAQQSNKHQDWLQPLAKKYNVSWSSDKPNWNQLLSHIDTIPTELVMAQAANESAWGISRFAQKGNNLFGQWCFKKGCGIVPGQRDSGANHEVRKFSSINDSVASYMHNLNSGRAYKDLRNLRADLRSSNKAVDGHTLANGLTKYSSRGKAYVKEIQSMIKTNKLLMQGTSKT
jgi:Bax protein